ncbi:MAG: PilZ domain-containing protein [Candidatus Krumholzibacteria bacterium]|nr:PilZ domain-containing protein [Candidatus Krumholzibacteria bacterium]
MQKLLTENLQSICRAVLNALVDTVPGEILACDLVQIDQREFHFQSVAAAHFAGGPVRRLLLGCEERLAQHFVAAIAPAGISSPGSAGATAPEAAATGEAAGPPETGAGLAAFCSIVRNNLLNSSIPWAGSQDFLVHDREQIRIQCDGVRNFLFRVAVAEGRLDLIIDLAPRVIGCEWLVDVIAGSGRIKVGQGEESITDPEVVGRIMTHLADAGADVQVKIPGDNDRLELLQATFLPRPEQATDHRLALTCARRTSLENADDIPEKVTLVFIMQDKLLQCSCQVMGHSHVWLDDDLALPILELSFPSAVTYGQRRGAFRLEPPERVLGTVQRTGDTSLAFKPMPIRVLDISFSGAKLLLSSNAMVSSFKGGTTVACVISLPAEFGEVTLQAVVRRLNLHLADQNCRGASLGVEFVEPDDSPALECVRRYIKDRHTARLSKGGAELKIG